MNPEELRELIRRLTGDLEKSRGSSGAIRDELARLDVIHRGALESLHRAQTLASAGRPFEEVKQSIDDAMRALDQVEMGAGEAASEIRNIRGNVETRFNELRDLIGAEPGAVTQPRRGSAPTLGRVPVESSNLRSIGYDPTTRVLEVEFTSGQVYRYRNVPPEMHKALMDAPSKGQFFIREIRSKASAFPYERVTGVMAEYEKGVARGKARVAASEAEVEAIRAHPEFLQGGTIVQREPGPGGTLRVVELELPGGKAVEWQVWEGTTLREHGTSSGKDLPLAEMAQGAEERVLERLRRGGAPSAYEEGRKFEQAAQLALEDVRQLYGMDSPAYEAAKALYMRNASAEEIRSAATRAQPTLEAEWAPRPSPKHAPSSGRGAYGRLHGLDLDVYEKAGRWHYEVGQPVSTRTIEGIETEVVPVASSPKTGYKSMAEAQRAAEDHAAKIGPGRTPPPK